MIVSLEGPMGSGKTVTASALAYTEHVKNGQRVVANYHLNFPYTHMDHTYWLAHLADNELTNCVIVLDEGYLESDSRLSGGRKERLWSYFYAQTRKRGVELFVPLLHIDEVDKRLRRKIDIRGTCTPNEETPCRGCEGTRPDDPKLGTGKVRTGQGICSKCGGSGQYQFVSEGTCAKCGGKGVTQVDSGDIIGQTSQPCANCGGVGIVRVKSEDTQTCSDCQGTGKGDVCKRCLGYGKTGTYTTRFVDFRKQRVWGQQRIKTIKIFGPAFWPLYDTLELVPFTAKQMRIPVEDL